MDNRDSEAPRTRLHSVPLAAVTSLRDCSKRRWEGEGQHLLQLSHDGIEHIVRVLPCCFLDSSVARPDGIERDFRARLSTTFDNRATRLSSAFLIGNLAR